jgi:hypothetical protein
MDIKSINPPPTEIDSPVWAGLKLAVRQRLAAAVTRLKFSGRLGRADLVEIGEISIPQASNDLAEIQRRLPGLMRYDRTRRCYVLGERLYVSGKGSMK